MLNFATRAIALLILALFTLVAISSAFEITWSRYKDSRSITVDAGSYSIAENYYLRQGLTSSASLSVFGNYAIDYRGWHAIVFNRPGQKWFDDWLVLITKAYHKANGDDSCGPGLTLIEPERYVFDGNVLKSSLGGRENFITYETNGYNVFMLDENKYSVGGPSLPEGVERVFVDDDMMTIVENDGNTIMKPIDSLSSRPDYEDLFKEISHSIRPVEDGRRILVSLDRRLVKMRKSLASSVRVEMSNTIDSVKRSFEVLENKINKLQISKKIINRIN